MKRQVFKYCLPLSFGFVFLSCSSNSANHKPKVYTVEIKQMQFQPSTLELEKGDTVVFKNEDMVTHDVTEAGSRKWSSSALPAGQSWKLVADKSTDYYCSIHQVMKGRLIVRKAE